MTAPRIFRATIPGAPVSKANSREVVHFGDRPAIIKSKDARKYETRARLYLTAMLVNGDLPPIPAFPKGTEVAVTIHAYYRNHRPDLDESIILDVLQGYAYANDRQVREKHVYHAIDKDNPRAEVEVQAR